MAIALAGALLFGPASALADTSDPHAGHHAGHAADHDDPGPVSDAGRSLASYPVPDVALIDQRGRRVPFAELLDTDAPVLLNFIFTTCTTICPAMSATFAQVQHDLGADRDRVRMLSVSIDPEQDTPDRMADYAVAFRARSQWYFLTGSLEESISVQQAFEAYRGDKMQHAPLTLLRPHRGARWVRYEGFPTTAELVGALREALGD